MLRVIRCVMGFCFLLVSVTLSLGQEIDADTTLQMVDSTLTVEDDDETRIPVPWALYIEYLPEYAPQLDQYGFNQQVGIGGSYKTFHLGLFVNLLREGITRPLVFPNEFDLIYLHNGVFAGLSLFSKGRTSVAIRYNFSFGTLVWENAETKEDLVRDYFTMSKPELILQYTLAPVFAIFGSIGYKIGHDINLPGFEQDNLNGMAFGIGVRAGFFQKGL